MKISIRNSLREYKASEGGRGVFILGWLEDSTISVFSTQAQQVYVCGLYSCMQLQIWISEESE